MSEPNWAEVYSVYGQWAGVVVAVISAIFVVWGLFYAAGTLKAQKLSTDVQNMLTVWAKLDEHWVRFQAVTDEKTRAFEFGQLISYYEIACALFKNNVFTTSAAVTLGEHLRDVIPIMQTNDHFKNLYAALQTRNDTYENIKWFEVSGAEKILELRKT